MSLDVLWYMRTRATFETEQIYLKNRYISPSLNKFLRQNEETTLHLRKRGRTIDRKHFRRQTTNTIIV